MIIDACNAYLMIARRGDEAEAAVDAVLAAYRLAEAAPDLPPLVYERIG